MFLEKRFNTSEKQLQLAICRVGRGDGGILAYNWTFREMLLTSLSLEKLKKLRGGRGLTAPFSSSRSNSYSSGAGKRNKEGETLRD